ncbi:MAG: DUF429 domain-containing protein [Planctomycetes bacterium]|nr:DUF429 domain-containing protein [Planctomycetota bacterium]
MILHGIDFSGAASGGAAKIRVVERDLLKRHEPIRSKGRMDRNGLVRHILESAKDGQPHLFRIDAPFGLALESLRQFDVAPTWSAMAEWLRDFKDPRIWRTAIRKISREEPRRECDRVFRTPMAPMNLRVFKQTWTLIAEVLKPLSEAGIRIEPVVRGETSNHVTVCEGCPASILKLLGLPDHGCKGAGLPPQNLRERLVRELDQEHLRVTDRIGQEAIADTEGDLLDAMLLLTDPLQWIPPATAAVEGWIY